MSLRPGAETQAPLNARPPALRICTEPTGFFDLVYRPDIDGLRAIAVLPVVLFHAGYSAFSGGFVGVDVFFVISGYLITLQIAGDIRNGTFSLVAFYNRRIRRIFPALFVVLLATFIAGAWLLLPADFERLAESAGATALFSANFYFWWTTDYFEVDNIKPLLHTWSLAVEEQFYVLFPPLLLGAWALLHRRWTALVVVLLLGSLAMSVWAVHFEHKGAFYFPHLRAWELMMGAVLALGMVPLPRTRPVREFLATVGIAAIAVAVFTYSKDTPFPGLAALLPCLGAALVVHAGTSGRTVVGTLLGIPPLVAIGLCSYSLYLWHWPLLEFARYYHIAPLPKSATAGIVVASLVASVFSWRFIEQPFRRNVRRNLVVFGSGSGMVVTALVFALLIIQTNGLPGRLSEDRLRYAAMLSRKRYDALYDRGGCFLNLHQTADDYDFDRCASSNAPLRILVWGDSHAAHLYPGLRHHFRDSETDVRQYTSSGCQPVIKGEFRCDAVYAGFERALESLDPHVVILAGLWSSALKRLRESGLASELSTSIRRATARGATVILAGQAPTYPMQVPMLGYMYPDMGHRDVATHRTSNHSKVNRLLRKIAEREGVAFYDFYDLCSGDACIVFKAGKPLHWDHGHMTLAGSIHYTTGLANYIRNAVGLTDLLMAEPAVNMGAESEGSPDPADPLTLAPTKTRADAHHR